MHWEYCWNSMLPGGQRAFDTLVNIWDMSDIVLEQTRFDFQKNSFIWKVIFYEFTVKNWSLISVWCGYPNHWDFFILLNYWLWQLMIGRCNKIPPSCCHQEFIMIYKTFYYSPLFISAIRIQDSTQLRWWSNSTYEGEVRCLCYPFSTTFSWTSST